MKRLIRITSIRRDPPDTTLLAQALIELVLYRREEDRQRAEQARKTKEGDNHEST